MPQSESQISDMIDAYFTTLDEVPFSPCTIFASQESKEKYETYLMYAFRKYQAARYHYDNIRSHMAKDYDKISTDIKGRSRTSSENSRYHISTRIMVRRGADHYAYELSAFLEALKSGVDFLSIVCGFHLSGISVRSVSTLMRLVRNGLRDSFFTVVGKNLDWLEKLRDYRHHVVHRRIFSVSIGGEEHTAGGATWAVAHPLVIPEHPPVYVPDTRVSRESDEDMLPDYDESEEWNMTTDKGKRSVDFSVQYAPSWGYVLLEDFVQYHIESFEKFFNGVVQALISLQFKVQSVQ